MSKNHLTNILLAILIAAVIYFGITITTALDRQRAASLRLAESKNLTPAAVAENSVATAEASAGGDFANREYFLPGVPAGGTLSEAFVADPPSLNPVCAGEATNAYLYRLCHLTLGERDWRHPEKFRPLLAERWEISDHGRTFRIFLRRGVMWHGFRHPDTGEEIPPRPVTAGDVVFAVKVIQDPDVNCAALRSYFQDLESVESNGDYEVTFHWKRQYYGALETTLSLSPLPCHFYPAGKFDGKKFNDDSLRNRMLVGCGPYKLTSWQRDREITLSRFENYCGRTFGAMPPIKQRKMLNIKMPNTQMQALLAGKIGFLGVTADQWQKRVQSPEFPDERFHKLQAPGMSYSYLGYNEQVFCFQDRRVRRALTMLINRREMLNKILHGMGRIANSPFVPGSAGADPALPEIPYDPKGAAELLAEAGWRDLDGDGILEKEGRKFSFTMLQISGSSLQLKTLPMIKNYLAAGGIEMRLQTVEWNVLLERLRARNFEACSLGWTGSFDPDMYQIFHSSQCSENGDNFISYKNPELDKLIVELRGEFNPEKRIELNRKIERILYDDQPYTFMYFPDDLCVVSKDFGNVNIYPAGVKSLNFYRKSAEP